MTNERACAEPYRGVLDAVILALPYDCGKVDYVEIMQDPLVLATPRQGVSPLLDPQTLLLLEDGHGLNDHGFIGCGLPKARASVMSVPAAYPQHRYQSAALRPPPISWRSYGRSDSCSTVACDRLV